MPHWLITSDRSGFVAAAVVHPGGSFCISTPAAAATAIIVIPHRGRRLFLRSADVTALPCVLLIFQVQLPVVVFVLPLHLTFGEVQNELNLNLQRCRGQRVTPEAIAVMTEPCFVARRRVRRNSSCGTRRRRRRLPFHHHTLHRSRRLLRRTSSHIQGLRSPLDAIHDSPPPPPSPPPLRCSCAAICCAAAKLRLL
jgi:hypothetical protein